MKTTAEYLDAMREKLDLPSDGRLADHLGIHRQHMSRYRTGMHGFDEAMCVKVARILEIEPEKILVDMMYIRAKQPEVKAAWKHTAEVLYGLAAVLAVVYFLPVIHLPSNDGLLLVGATLPESAAGTLYIMSNRRMVNFRQKIVIYTHLLF